MDLLSPSALWWLLGLALLLLLPRIRLPREQRRSAAIHLWAATEADERPRPTVRLRRQLLLLLQAAAIIAIAIALARPALLAGGGTAALILDVSASMGARSADGTRLDSARAEALEELAALPWGSRVHLFSASDEIVAHGEFGARSAALRTALGQLRLRATGARLNEAVDTARSIVNGGRIFVATDASPIARGEAVRWLQVGEDAPNVAVTAFAARPLPDSPLDAELLTQVTNFSPSAVGVDLVVNGPAGPLYRAPLSLAPWQARSVVLDLRSQRGEFTASLDHKDALEADNSRTATIAARAVRVGFQGSASRFTRAAVDTNPVIAVAADGHQADVIVCGRCPAVPNGEAHVLLLDSPASALPRLHPRHPVAAAVRPFAVRGRAWTEGARRMLRLGIDDEDPRLVRDTAFPVLIAASLEWLAGPAVREGHGVPASESDLRIGRAAGAAGNAGALDLRPAATPIPLALPFLLTALGLMCLEWRAACRRRAAR